MKTQIIIKKGWITIAEYEQIIPLSEHDIVVFKNIEYEVDCCSLDIDSGIFVVLLNDE